MFKKICVSLHSTSCSCACTQDGFLCTPCQCSCCGRNTYEAALSRTHLLPWCSCRGRSCRNRRCISYRDPDLKRTNRRSSCLTRNCCCFQNRLNRTCCCTSFWPASTTSSVCRFLAVRRRRALRQRRGRFYRPVWIPTRIRRQYAVQGR
jgi:hypothetical protein